MTSIVLDAPLTWQDVARIAAGEARLELSPEARTRIEAAHGLVRAIVDRDIRAYGVNTGVGALSDTTIPKDRQSALSHNILLSHAAGVGAPLTAAETRAIMACAINNFAHGYSGLRLDVVERLLDLLNAGCIPLVPRQGSVGYLSHMAHIGIVLIGHGQVEFDGRILPAAEALKTLHLAPLRLEAKEGLCLVNGTPCVTGLACLALERSRSLLQWADTVAAMTFEVLQCQTSAFQSPALALRHSPGMAQVVANLSRLLEGSHILAEAKGRRTQDALSLRSIPQIHGACRDVFADVEAVVARELQSVTDNPVVMGEPLGPEVYMQSNAVGAGIALAMDSLAIAMAQLGAMSERRIDRMVNPLVSGLPAFLANSSGVDSGFMIAQYTAASLAGDSRRLAAPASLDGGITSGLQEDILCHATPAALKALAILDNTQHILAIELLAVCQACDLSRGNARRAAGTREIYLRVREAVPAFQDDRPLSADIERVRRLMESSAATPES